MDIPIKISSYRFKKSGNYCSAWARPEGGTEDSDLWRIDVWWDVPPTPLDEKLWRRKYFLRACKRLIARLPCGTASVIGPDWREHRFKKEGMEVVQTDEDVVQ